MALAGGGGLGALAGTGTFIAGAVTGDGAFMATGGALALTGLGTGITAGIKQMKNIMSGGAFEDMSQMMSRPGTPNTRSSPPRGSGTKPGSGLDR